MKLYNCLIKSFQSRHKIIDKSLPIFLLESLKNVKIDNRSTSIRWDYSLSLWTTITFRSY